MDEQIIFNDALERTDPQERAAYLNEACGDDEALRRRIESLLASYDEAGDFLEHSPIEPAAPPARRRRTLGCGVGILACVAIVGLVGYALHRQAQKPADPGRPVGSPAPSFVDVNRKDIPSVSAN